ncbi:MAG: hypothetical protein SCM11_17465, partial [Bacillota bacterium]|nr:hypothetical protein [Bacillota bacterium]
ACFPLIVTDSIFPPRSARAQTEAASLGCALIGGVSAGVYPDYETAVSQAISWKETYMPQPGNIYAGQVQRYDLLYKQLQPVFQLDDTIWIRPDCPVDELAR